MKKLNPNSPLLRKDGHLRKEYRDTINRVNGTRIYHTQTRGRGRYINYYSFRHTLVELLNELGYKYREGNDAPRGGRTGDYIVITKSALKGLKGLAE